MNRDDLRRLVITTLCDVAPGCGAEEVAPGADLRDSLDLDSMDFLNFVIALHKALGIDIPEADYRRLATLDACVEYLAARTA